MIFGIGTDVCDVRRIRTSMQRHGERFALRILSDREMTVWRSRSARWPERGLRYLATRFSAKEAFSKAVGLGMHLPMTWRLCEIANLPKRPAGGRPARRTQGMVRGQGPDGSCHRDRRNRLRRQLCRGRKENG